MFRCIFYLTLNWCGPTYWGRDFTQSAAVVIKECVKDNSTGKVFFPLFIWFILVLFNLSPGSIEHNAFTQGLHILMWVLIESLSKLWSYTNVSHENGADAGMGNIKDCAGKEKLCF